MANAEWKLLNIVVILKPKQSVRNTYTLWVFKFSDTSLLEIQHYFFNMQ